jgi:hypothetical protein
MLGYMCLDGLGAPKDDQLAYFWFLLVSVGSDANSEKNRDEVEKLLATVQIRF